jgi:hypothetical protein
VVGESSASRSIVLAAALAGFSLLALLVQARAPAALDQFCRSLVSRRFLSATVVFVLTVFVVLVALNTAFPGYLDHAESNIASVSWLLLRGAPLYHPIDFASRYSLLYGPTTYLPFAAALGIGGGTLLSLKASMLVANFVMVFFLWRSYRPLLDPLGALVALALVLTFLFVPRPNHYLFQIRSDVWIICAMAVGLFGASRREGLAGPIALTAAAAFVVDTKASGIIYVLPLLAMFYGARGWRASLMIAVGIACVAALPFLAPNVSLRQYAQWLRRATGHPRAMLDLLSTLRTLPILAMPLFLILGPTPWRDARVVACLRENRLVLLTLGLCLALAIAASTRIGAGSHHLLPFLPLIGYEAILLFKAADGRFARRHPLAFRYLFACTAVVALARVGGGVHDTCATWARWKWAEAVGDDVHAVLTRYGGHEVAMGYGDALDPVTNFRPAIVFATDRLPLDTVALSDMEMDKIPLPKATLDALDECTTDVWLIPKGQEPFATGNTFSEFYPLLVPRGHLFNSEFRATFARRYSKAESTPYFDVWTCRPSAVGSRG